MKSRIIAELGMNAKDALKFSCMYFCYGVGYRWSYCNNGELPKNPIEKLSLDAKRVIEDSDPSFGKDVGYFMAAVPGAIVGEIAYFLLKDE
jgi:hypothetical protein